MKKIISLIKACMTEDMNLFKINNKKKTKMSRKAFPIFIAILLFFSFWSYANILMEPLNEIHLEYVALTLFIIATTIMMLIEGIYKASNLLFNCKDDDLIFSLPIKKSTVLFIRIFKFYLFELLYNSLFLAPAMVAYVRYVNVDITFYIVSIIGLIVFPIIPVIISGIIGGVISGISSRFKYKNVVQIIITTMFLLGMFYVSFNLENIIKDIVENATSINDIITKIYYPAGSYINLITNFNIKDLVIFIAIHLAIFAVAITILRKSIF